MFSINLNYLMQLSTTTSQESEGVAVRPHSDWWFRFARLRSSGSRQSSSSQRFSSEDIRPASLYENAIIRPYTLFAQSFATALSRHELIGGSVPRYRCFRASGRPLQLPLRGSWRGRGG